MVINGGRRMIIVIQRISGKPFTENSIILIPVDIWISDGKRLTENGTTLAEKMMEQWKRVGRLCMVRNIILVEQMMVR